MLDLERAFWLTVLVGGVVAVLTMLGVASSGFLIRTVWPRFRAPHGGTGRPIARNVRGRRHGGDT